MRDKLQKQQKVSKNKKQIQKEKEKDEKSKDIFFLTKVKLFLDFNFCVTRNFEKFQNRNAYISIWKNSIKKKSK